MFTPNGQLFVDNKSGILKFRIDKTQFTGTNLKDALNHYRGYKRLPQLSPNGKTQGQRYLETLAGLPQPPLKPFPPPGKKPGTLAKAPAATLAATLQGRPNTRSLTVRPLGTKAPVSSAAATLQSRSGSPSQTLGRVQVPPPPSTRARPPIPTRRAVQPPPPSTRANPPIPTRRGAQPPPPAQGPSTLASAAASLASTLGLPASLPSAPSPFAVPSPAAASASPAAASASASPAASASSLQPLATAILQGVSGQTPQTRAAQGSLAGLPSFTAPNLSALTGVSLPSSLAKPPNGMPQSLPLSVGPSLPGAGATLPGAGATLPGAGSYAAQHRAQKTLPGYMRPTQSKLYRNAATARRTGGARYKTKRHRR